MPSALSLAIFSTQKKTSTFDWEVPWEVAGYREDAEIAKARGGIFDLSPWATISIQGRDALDFLQRLSTTNFKKLTDGEFAHGAFLTGKGTVVGLGIFEKLTNGAYFYVNPAQRAVVLEHVEKFHFSEQLEIADKSEEWALFGVCGDATKLDWLATPGSGKVWRDNDYVPPLIRIVPRAEAPALLLRAAETEVSLLGDRLYHFLRRQAGVPLVGWEITPKELLLECNFDRSVAPNKGCYPGQEVVERILTYGSVNRRLQRVELIPPPESPTGAISICVDGKSIGTVATFDTDPVAVNRALALAYIHKAYWDRTQAMNTDLPGVTARIIGH